MYAISEEEINEIVNREGQVRGGTLCTDAEYVRRHEGEEALRLVEEETKRMGYPIDYDTVKLMDWYPLGLRIVSLFAISKTLNWGDEQLREMGKTAPKYSIITKLMLRYFVSLEALAERLGTYWRRNYTVGSLTGKVNNRSVFLRLEDFLIPQPLYPYLGGYFVGAMGMVIGNDKGIIIEETNHLQGDGECYDFILSW